MNNDFDFWIGEWDINLRVHQEKNIWEEKNKSTARIYSMLDGNVILELWQEKNKPDGIIGYSLRHFDEDSNEWVIWLNWPGKNRSGTTSLKGNFRHGRGEFFSDKAINDSTTLLSRYTFSDITHNNLRWDDAYSRDSGKTWTNNWIMEFSRSKTVPTELLPGTNNLTNFSLRRCDPSQFDVIKKLSRNEPVYTSEGSIHYYGILDGCSVVILLKSDDYQQLSVLTFNTYAQVYEELVYDKTTKKTEIYYGRITDNTLQLSTLSKLKKRNITIKNRSFQLEEYSHDEKIRNIFIKGR